MGKIKSLSSLKKIVEQLQKKGKKVVFTNGCFDILHTGHIKIFKEAKAKGDILIVGLNSDSSIQSIKGPTRPIKDQKVRAIILEAIEHIDYVIIFNQDTPLNLIKKLAPDYLVKGGDWGKDEIIGSEFVKKVFRVKIAPGHSTTNIVKKIETTQ